MWALLFVVVFASFGYITTTGLLARKKWRRYLPYALPLFFVMVSLGLSYRLDAGHRDMAASPEGQALRQGVIESCLNDPSS